MLAYIPTVAILREGGHAGHTSQMAFGLPAKWKESIEPLIMADLLNWQRRLELQFRIRNNWIQIIIPFIFNYI